MRNLDAIPVVEWTEEEAFTHLMKTFYEQAEQHQNLLEPYVVLLESAVSPAEQTDVMRRGLRETIKRRYRLAPEQMLLAG